MEFKGSEHRGIQKSSSGPLTANPDITRMEEQGHKGLLDRRRGTPSRRRVPKAKTDEVLSLYRDQYFDPNVRHFHEKLREDHQIGLSYTWVKQALRPAW